MGLIVTGLIGMFFPYSKTMDLVYGGFGALLFSGYIVFDVSCPMLGRHRFDIPLDLQHQSPLVS